MRIVIVGPTASGKTGLAIDVAKRIGGQIIAADSRTVYKGMDIGTAKPTLEEQALVKHYCLDIVDPGQRFTAADFSIEAKKAEAAIIANGKIPIIVGGSGLYIDSYIYEFTFSSPNLGLRDKYKNYSIDALKKEIHGKGLKMPNNYKNKTHLLSTLERQGRLAPAKRLLPAGTLLIGLNPPKDILKERITLRAEQMIKQGVINESKSLFDTYGKNTTVLKSGAYGVLARYFDGELTSIEQISDECAKSDMKLVKKQLTWFRRNKDIKWFSDKSDAEQWLLSKTKCSI